jgi:hypothetical protein
VEGSGHVVSEFSILSRHLAERTEETYQNLRIVGVPAENRGPPEYKPEAVRLERTF